MANCHMHAAPLLDEAEPVAEEVATKTTLAPKSERMMCVDAMRGFDMFWIVGADDVVRALAANSHNRFMQALGMQFEHVDWAGCHFYDLIFPIFLFIIGLSMPFSFSKRLERGDSKAAIYKHVLIRVLVLVLLGTVIHGNVLSLNWHRFTASYSVLMVLALGYLVASVILLNLKLRGQIIATVALIVVYWALMDYVPVPGHVVGVYAPGKNLGDWLNNFVLRGAQGPWHNGWILQSLTNGATAMLGVLGGHLLRSRKTDKQKLLWMLALGVACLAIGWVWSGWFPIIKRRWTSTYVLWAAGWSYLGLAVFFWIVDVRRYRKWVIPFVVIGSNALVAYIVWGVFAKAFRLMADILVHGLQQYVGGWYDTIAWMVAMSILWLGLYCLYRTRTFIKI